MPIPFLLTVVLLALVPTPAAAAAPWTSPVPGAAIVRGFHVTPTAPYGPGQRRGLVLAAAPGTTVGSACGGTVTFAGRPPTGGRGVSVRCGRLTATHLGLASVAVGRGARVLPGTTIGTAAGPLRLGARLPGRPHRYVDPAGLLGAARTRPPVVPSRAPRAPRPASAPPRAAPAPVRVGRGPDPAAVVWAGLGLLALGVPLHGIAWRGVRRGRGGAAPQAARRAAP